MAPVWKRNDGAWAEAEVMTVTESGTYFEDGRSTGLPSDRWAQVKEMNQGQLYMILTKTSKTKK